MASLNKKQIEFVNLSRFFANCLINGTPLDVLERRYPEYDFYFQEDSLSIRRKGLDEKVKTGITEKGFESSEQVDMSIDSEGGKDVSEASAEDQKSDDKDASDELAGAKAAASKSKAAKKAKSLTDVE
jgi:hypothetical protein